MNDPLVNFRTVALAELKPGQRFLMVESTFEYQTVPRFEYLGTYQVDLHFYKNVRDTDTVKVPMCKVRLYLTEYEFFMLPDARVVIP